MLTSIVNLGMIRFNVVVSIGKLLKKAVNGFRLKRYYSAAAIPPQVTPDSVFQLGSSESSDDDSIPQLPSPMTPLSKVKKYRKHRALENRTVSDEGK